MTSGNGPTDNEILCSHAAGRSRFRRRASGQLLRRGDDPPRRAENRNIGLGTGGYPRAPTPQKGPSVRWNDRTREGGGPAESAGRPGRPDGSVPTARGVGRERGVRQNRHIFL